MINYNIIFFLNLILLLISCNNNQDEEKDKVFSQKTTRISNQNLDTIQQKKENINIKKNIQSKAESILNKKKILSQKEKDSVDIIAKKFIWFNKYTDPKVYEIEEPDLHSFVMDNKELSLKYLPLILSKYELTMPRKILLYYYLYSIGNKEYLQNIDCNDLDKLDSLALDQSSKILKFLIPVSENSCKI